MANPFRVLCIGGSDSGGGAGIQADLKAVFACGCYGTTVITALTAQNSRGVAGIFPVPRRFIAAQLDSVLSDIGTDAVKTGMMLTTGVVSALAKRIKDHQIEKLVIDPVMTAKGGRTMMLKAARNMLVNKLMPQALVVTPNIPEAESLSGCDIRSVAGMKKAAAVILTSGVKNVIIKGGHLSPGRAKDSVDVLYDGKKYHEFAARRIHTKNTHGTGCTFASALAAYLARGFSVYDAAFLAKQVVTKAIEKSIYLGAGHGPVHLGSNLTLPAADSECLVELQKAAAQLTSVRCGRLIPDASSNFVYAPENANNESQVAGFPGRIIRLCDEAFVVSEPAFGASKRMAHFVLTVMKYNPAYRSAMNIKYFENISALCKKADLTADSFDPHTEPVYLRDKDGQALDMGVQQVLNRSSAVPDVIYDKGGQCEEPMVRVLGRNPAEVVAKVMKILNKL